jgi:uncharacterized protein (DUF1697 family)
MTVYIALLHAVNVGGTGKLAMADLQALCRKAASRMCEPTLPAATSFLRATVL